MRYEYSLESTCPEFQFTNWGSVKFSSSGVNRPLGYVWVNTDILSHAQRTKTIHVHVHIHAVGCVELNDKVHLLQIAICIHRDAEKRNQYSFACISLNT